MSRSRQLSIACAIASLRDLVKHHPLHRHVRLEHLEEMPRDRLALAVFVRGEIELARVLQPGFELGDHMLLVGRHDVDRREVVVDVDAEPADLRLRDVLRHFAVRRAEVSRIWPMLAMTT